MRFIDLFAWLWWFHIALSDLWHECVFASEKDEELRELYKENYLLEANWDITKVKEQDIPSHDILCAWFPCQPFSHAWKQNGLQCDKNGNLFYEIIRILKYHKPKYFILENVANLLSHDEWNTWKTIYRELSKLWYDVDKEILSPHDFNIPHHRKRIFIVWKFKSLNGFEWPEKIKYDTSIDSILDSKSSKKDFRYIWKKEQEAIKVWQNILNDIPKEHNLPWFPIWGMEFWATYPFEDFNPLTLSEEELGKYKWSFGQSLKWKTKEEQIKLLPWYVSYHKHLDNFPSWKKNFIRNNRAFFKENSKFLKPYFKDLKKMIPSFQKLEWNCQWEVRDLYKLLIQFRASGIRVKRTDFSPSLISSTSTQVPVIASQWRYMTKKEASRLQWMWNINLPDSNSSSFRALWNALNADIVNMIAKNLIK